MRPRPASDGFTATYKQEKVRIEMTKKSGPQVMFETTGQNTIQIQCNSFLIIEHHKLSWKESRSLHTDRSRGVTFAVPDADHLSFEGILSTEWTCVSRVLRHFHLLHGLPQGGAITRGVLASDPDFLRAFRHFQN